ncbi:zinc finger domain-containing protein [Streptomyces cadmiisoli]|uniref:zinc finger domain-containing protein n=1 Tax=Streptomyces cadmiisoli TaxID=2184053 RepID=UPI00364C2070
MTAPDWTPQSGDIAATREARRNGSFRGLLRQQITEGKARLGAGVIKEWPSGKRRDIGGTTCPHCGAGPDQRCHLRTRNQTLPAPHQQRIAVWAQTVACCPECQAIPGQRCHLDGIALPAATVHARRYQEAEATAA